MKDCIAECETKAQAVGLGKIENLLLRMAQKLDEGGGSGGGANDVYTVRLVIEYTEEAETMTTEGTLQEAIAAYKQGKDIQFLKVYRIDGQESVASKSFGFSVPHNGSKVTFFCIGSGGNYGFSILQAILTEDGVSVNFLGGGDTAITRLYVVSQGGFFLHSSTVGSKKLFRIEVDDSGNLSTEYVNDLE